MAKGALKKAKAGTLDAFLEATHLAFIAVTAEEARGFFGHCGYGSPRAQTL